MATRNHSAGDPYDDSVEQVACPTCGRDDFDSQNAMRTHHTLSHGESLLAETTKCEQCGEQFEPRSDTNGRFCSRDCANEFRRHDRKEHTCKECGDTFKALPSDNREFCSRKCFNRTQRDQKTLRCANCDRPFRAQKNRNPDHCGRSCDSEARLRRPRPENVPMLLWLLYVYEDYNLQQTFERQRAVIGNKDCLKKEEVREVLKNLNVLRARGGAKYEVQLREADFDSVVTDMDEDEEIDDAWQQYYGPGGGSA